MKKILINIVLILLFCGLAQAQTPTGVNKGWYDELWVDMEGTFTNIVKEYWIDTDMDTTAIKAVFDSACAQASAKITFKYGKYSFAYSTYGNIDIVNANNLTIEGNVSTLDFN